MKILTSNHYNTGFTVPPQVRHTIERVRFVNLGRVWSPAEAIAAYPPMRRYDRVHFINNIPLSLRTPWLVTFESNLPRIYPRAEPLNSYLLDRLNTRHCLAIIAMSGWALGNFKQANAGWDGLAKALAKARTLHPTIALKDPVPRSLRSGETIKIIFVGHNFARKGGIVALRLARKAIAEGLPLEIHLVSKMVYANGAHTDHPDPARYQADLQNLDLPNVVFHGAIPNQKVMELMRACHINLLPTLHDTYGFSVIEGFATGLPAITTDVCALPEFVFGEPDPRANGYLLHLPVDGRNCWQHVNDSRSPGYWETVDAAYESMADQALACLRSLAEAPDQLERLSQGAIAGIEQRHNPAPLAEALEAIYSQAR